MTPSPSRSAAALLGLLDDKPAASAPVPSPAPMPTRGHRPRYRRNKRKPAPLPPPLPDVFEREPDGQDAAPIFAPGERVKTLKIYL